MFVIIIIIVVVIVAATVVLVATVVSILDRLLDIGLFLSALLSSSFW